MRVAAARRKYILQPVRSLVQVIASSRAGVASTISPLQDRAMVAAIVAGQLSEQLAQRADAARFADSLRAEHARLLRRVSDLQRRSALAVVRAADASLPD
jgi:hypothetical protein